MDRNDEATMSVDDSDGAGFLGRWTRRKQQARRQADATEAPSDAPEPRGDVGVANAEMGEADRAETPPAGIDPADLPDIDSLTAESDVSPFLQEGVPEALKRKALRRLWGLDPVFANIDGLNDYDLDYTDAATVVKNLKTAYQVGRGYVADEEMAGDTAGVRSSAVPEAAPDQSAAQTGHGEADTLPDPDAHPHAPSGGGPAKQAASDAPLLPENTRDEDTDAEDARAEVVGAGDIGARDIGAGDIGAGVRERSRRALERRWGGVSVRSGADETDKQ
jgi:hypothetical protein